MHTHTLTHAHTHTHTHIPQRTDQNAAVPPLGLQLADPLDSGSDYWGSDTCFEEELSVWRDLEVTCTAIHQICHRFQGLLD